MMSGKTNLFRFTKSAINQIPPSPKGKQLEYLDTQVKGLRLRVGSTGKKTFFVVRNGKEGFIRVKVGNFPDMSVETARAVALKQLGDLSLTRKNPNKEQKTVEESNEEANEQSNVTLREALNHYLDMRGERIKETTAKQYTSLLSNFSHDWFDLPLAKISRRKVTTRHKQITDGSVWFGSPEQKNKKNVGKGSKAQADLWGRVLRAVYLFAYDYYRDDDEQRLLPEPPTQALTSQRQWNGSKRKTTRIRNHDLGRWYRAVNAVLCEAEAISDFTAMAVCDAVITSLFTGMRKGEVLGLKWDNVNLEGGYIQLQDTKNKRDTEIPITDTIREIITRRDKWRIYASDYVYPSFCGEKIENPRRTIIQIMDKTTIIDGEYKSPVKFCFHDLRRTFASIAELSGVGIYTIKKLMNHKSGQGADVTIGYINMTADELLQPSQTIEKRILQEIGMPDNKGNNENVNIDEFIDKLSPEEISLIKSKLLNM
ncbi:site-specific integrase [Escherichia coli]|nr:site-specific integrase [Escherichia coli]EFF7915681.1 site-specific integrase [Escherichia coli]